MKDWTGPDGPFPPDADALADQGLDTPRLTNDDIAEPTDLAQSNMDRLSALNALGVGINGVNEALMLRMMEELLGPIRTGAVKREHEEWLATQLSQAEEQVATLQEQAAENQRRASILRRN